MNILSIFSGSKQVVEPWAQHFKNSHTLLIDRLTWSAQNHCLMFNSLTVPCNELNTLYNNNNWILPGLICPTELWRPGVAQDLPTHWPGTRVWTQVCGWNAPYAVEGRNFHGPQRDAAWLFLTVFIALTAFPHGVFPLRSDVRDLPTATRLDNGNIWPPHGELPTRLDFASWLVCPLHCMNFSLNSAIFLYTAGPTTSFRPLTSASD